VALRDSGAHPTESLPDAEVAVVAACPALYLVGRSWSAYGCWTGSTGCGPGALLRASWSASRRRPWPAARGIPV